MAALESWGYSSDPESIIERRRYHAEEIFLRIEHGDEAHRRWLKSALIAWAEHREHPPVEGMVTKEALLSRLDGAQKLFTVALIAAIILFCTAWTCDGAEPVAKISGPKEAASGIDVIEFKTDGTVCDDGALSWATPFAERKVVDYIDRPSQKPRLKIIAPPDGTWRLTLTAAGLVDGKVRLSVTTHTVVIGGSTPGPSPPGPGPTPPKPDLTETGKLVYEWAASVGNKAEAKQLAENYAAITSGIAAEAYKNLEFTKARSKIVADVYQLNEPISRKNQKWGTFFKSLGEHFKELDGEGKLDSVEKIGKLFGEIKAGLEAAS